MKPVSVIGRGCRSDQSFTEHLARALGRSAPIRCACESDRAFLIRRLKPLQVYSRHWATADLSRLRSDQLAVAAMQICDAAANFAQDRLAEQLSRSQIMGLKS